MRRACAACGKGAASEISEPGHTHIVNNLVNHANAGGLRIRGTDGLGDTLEVSAHGLGSGVGVVRADRLDDGQVLGEGNARAPWVVGEPELVPHGLPAESLDGLRGSPLTAHGDDE